MTPEIFSRELGRIRGEIPVIFRDDDASEIIPELQQLIDIFQSVQIPLHLAAIPARLSKETASCLLDQKHTNNAPIEIGQHGYSHTNHAASGDYEFGPSRSYPQQYDDILNGRKRMQQLFGDDFQPVFTPPFHGFDENTLRCVQELDFEIFSSTQRLHFRRYAYSFREVSINLDPVTQYEPYVIYKSEDALLSEILEKARKQRYLGFNLHHQLLTEAFANQLENLLHLLHRQPNVKFYHLSQFGQEWGSTALLFPTKARAIKYYVKKLLWSVSRGYVH